MYEGERQDGSVTCGIELSGFDQLKRLINPLAVDEAVVDGGAFNTGEGFHGAVQDLWG